MTSNVSLYTEAELDRYKLLYTKFTIQGALLTLVNATILLSVCVHRVLRERKECIIIAGLASVDMLTGLGALTAGVGRVTMLALDAVQQPIPRHWCLLAPWTWFMIVKPHVNGLMLCIVSVERLIAVAFPFYYFSRRVKHSLLLIALPYLHALLPFCYIVISILLNPEPITPFCWVGTKSLLGGWSYHRYSEPLFSTLSVLLYGVVLVAYFNRKPVQGLAADVKSHIKQQRKVTRIIGITALCTLCFETFPRLLILAGEKEEQRALPVVGWLLYFIRQRQYLIRNLNPFCNIFIYTVRYRAIRLGIIKLYSCKRLTEVELKKYENPRIVAKK